MPPRKVVGKRHHQKGTSKHRLRESGSHSLTRAVSRAIQVPSTIFTAGAGVVETKDEKMVLVDPKVERPVLKLAEMFRLAIGSQTMDFVLHLKTTLASDGSGVLRGFIPLDPSLGSYVDYPSVAALFDEVKLIESVCQFYPLLSATSASGAGPTTAITNAVFAGYDRDAYNTSTASSDQVFRLDGSEAIVTLHGDNLVNTIRWKVPSTRDFCSTAVPTTIDPPAGCCGVIRYGANTTVSNSTTYYTVGIKNKYRFRNRV